MRRYPSRVWSRKWVIVIALAWLVFVLVWLVGRCDGLGGPPLIIIWSDDPGDYDPHRTSHPVAQSVFQYVCQPLFYEDYDGALRGLLVEDNVEYADGGRRLTVRVRPDVTFQDGTRLDAVAVQASFERLKRLGLSPLLNDLRDVAVEAQPDGRSVTFTLLAPDFEFARLVLSNPYAAIISPMSGDLAAPGFVACTGPYRFEPSLYRPGQSLTVVRYPAYRWPPAYFANRGAAYIPQMRFVFEADRAARLDALLSGEGCVLSLSQEQVAPVAAFPRFRLRETMGGVTYLGFNFQRPRWQNAQARQAVAMAIDKVSLAEQGPFLVADTPLSPAMTGYDARAVISGYSYDPDQSRALLAQAGFDARSEVVLLIPESKTYQGLAEAVQLQLQAVGLERLTIRAVPRADILSQRQDFDLLLFDYAWGDYTALGIFLGPGPRNLLNYSEGDVVGLVTHARTIADVNLRQQFVLDAQRIVLEQAVWQPLLVRRITFAVDGTCVQGERQSPEGDLFFHDAKTGF